MTVTVTVNMNDGNEDQFEDEIVGSIDDWSKGIEKNYPNWSSVVIVFVKPVT